MRVTIGELIDEMLLYGDVVECKHIGVYPYFKFVVKDHYDMAAFYIYIMQTEVNKYCICSSDDDFHMRYIPVSDQRRFVLESEFCQGNSCNIPQTYRWKSKARIIHNICRIGVMEYIHDEIVQRGISKISRKDFTADFSIHFKSPRIIWKLTDICKFNGVSPSIKGFATAIKSACPNQISLINMKERDAREIIEKFKYLGVRLTVQEKVIKDVKIEIKAADKNNKKYISI